MHPPTPTPTSGRSRYTVLTVRAVRTAALHSLCSQDAQVELHVIEGDVVDSEFGRYVVLATYLPTAPNSEFGRYVVLATYLLYLLPTPWSEGTLRPLCCRRCVYYYP